MAGATYLKELLLQCRHWNVGGAVCSAVGAIVALFQASIVPSYALDSTLPSFSAVKMLFERKCLQIIPRALSKSVFQIGHVFFVFLLFVVVLQQLFDPGQNMCLTTVKIYLWSTSLAHVKM